MTTPHDEKQETVPIKPTIITGYQFGDDGHFIGEYRFEKNKDKEEVHLPPRTTLLPPPSDLEVDQDSFFNGNAWEIRRLEMPYLPDRALPTESDDQPDDTNETIPDTDPDPIPESDPEQAFDNGN